MFKFIFLGQTALYLAARQGHSTICLSLLNHDGFDSLNAQMAEHRSTAAHGINNFFRLSNANSYL
jgi:hypothetical protein